MGEHWPPETSEFEIIIDETVDVVLTRTPFRLRDNYYVLRSFLDVAPAPLSPIASAARKRAAKLFKDAGAKPFTERDEELVLVMEAMIRPSGHASESEVEQAKRLLGRLLAKKSEREKSQASHDLPDYLRPYYQVVPRYMVPRYNDAGGADPRSWVKRRAYMVKYDDIYAYATPLAAWLLTGAW